MTAKLRKYNDMIIKLLFLFSFIGETITLRSDGVMNIGEYLIHLSCYDGTDYGTSNVTFIINRNITAVGDHEGKAFSIMSQLNAPIFPHKYLY